MKRKHIFILIALVAALAMLLTACNSDKPKDTGTQQGGQSSLPLGLESWSMDTTTWSSPNGATVNLTATPNGHAKGQSAAFIVRLEGEEVANVPCEFSGGQYTASADLNAADGYCYYVLLTDTDGTQTEVGVNTPTETTDAALINLASSLEAYCNVMVDAASFTSGKLTITSGTAQVQLPQITNDGKAITCSEATLILSFNGQEVSRSALTLDPAGADGICKKDLANTAFSVPAMEDDQQLTVRMDVTLSNGQMLTAPVGTWYYSGGELMLAVG